MFKLETMGGDASLLNLAANIDRGIRTKLREKESPRAQFYRKLSKMTKPLRYFMLIAYVLLTQFEKPSWCLDIKYQMRYGNVKQMEKYQDFDSEKCDDAAGNYTSFGLPKVSEVWSNVLAIVLLLGLQYFYWVKNQYRSLLGTSLLSYRIVIFMTVVSVIDCIIAIANQYYYAWFAALIRPFYLIVSINMLRNYCFRFLLVIKDSTPMVIFIVFYIIYFSSLGQRIFSGTLEGKLYFDTFFNSFFNMLVLMTTSNFPDVMLPAYQKDRIACLFFIAYLTLGLFLIMNLLLAIFYSNFKVRFA